MDREQALKLAQAAGITFVTKFGVASATAEWIEKFASLIAAAVKEEDALICDDRYMGDNNREDMEARRCAAAIRASIKEGK